MANPPEISPRPLHLPIQVPMTFQKIWSFSFDPDPINTRFGNTTVLSLTAPPCHPEPKRVCPGGDGDACMISTGEPTSSNPVCCTAPMKCGCLPPVVRFDPSTTLTVTPLLATCSTIMMALTTGRNLSPTSGATDTSTDMKWITPVLISQPISRRDHRPLVSRRVSSIVSFVDAAERSVICVEAIAGTKERLGCQAGPASVAATLPADANQRNLAILCNLRNVSTGGVEIFAQGYLPVTSYLFDPLTLPIAAISSAQAVEHP